MRQRHVILAGVLLVIGLCLLTLKFSRSVGGNPSLKVESPAVLQGMNAQQEVAAQRALERQRKASMAAQGVGTNLTVVQRLVAGDYSVGNVSREQIEANLVRNKTNAASLLTAWQAGGDKDYIKHAAELFPNDPRVQLAVLNLNLFPEQQRQWLDRLKQSDPENPMANYLSARDYLLTGHPEQALKEMSAAAGKTKYQDYTMERIQDLEELQMESGHSVAEAKLLAGTGLLVPQYAQLKELTQQLGLLQQNYLAAGDLAAAAQIAGLGQGITRELGNGQSGGSSVVSQLVGFAMERNLLKGLPPESQPEFLGMSVQQRLDQMSEQRNQLRALTPFLDEMLARGNEKEIIGYFDRMKSNGETSALQWLASHNTGN